MPILNIDENRALFKHLIDSLTLNGLFNRFRNLGCRFENIKSEHTCPVYINLLLPDTIEVPFIAITEPGGMINGELIVWIGIDNSDMAMGVSITDYSNPASLEGFIKRQTKSHSTLIYAFCEYAFKVSELTHQINNQVTPKY